MSKRNIIVSCTTTKERIHMLFYMIESLKKQHFMPDVLYVNISEGSYLSDEGISEVPEWLNQNFIRINRTENIGSYRKLLPVIKKAKDNDLMITADDDILYGPNWIKSLVELAEKYPRHIVCARAREMKKNIFGKWQNYSRWNLISSTKEGMLILPTGCGGAVYRKNLLDLDFLFDPAFKELAPTTDDLWFRMASLRQNVPVLVDPNIDQENIYLRHNVGLEQQNIKRYGSYFEKVYKNTIELMRDWVGLSNSINDFSWSCILKHSNKFDVKT